MTVENDPSWAEQVRSRLGHDSRLRLEEIGGAVASWVACADVGSYDLVFVDDSTTAVARSQSISALIARLPARSVVVIHDYEVADYRMAAERCPNRYRVTALNPNVGICWWSAGLRAKDLARLDAAIQRDTSRLEPDDADGWLTALGSFLRSSADGGRG